jgi:hypothetical protein
MQKYLDTAINDLRILSGDIVGPSDATWQDVAGTAVTNLLCLATAIERAKNGSEPFPVFPEVRIPPE